MHINVFPVGNYTTNGSLTVPAVATLAGEALLRFIACRLSFSDGAATER